ncbi:MAG: hypothetical protein WC045_03000 [Patescibacteria group bacterium]
MKIYWIIIIFVFALYIPSQVRAVAGDPQLFFTKKGTIQNVKNGERFSVDLVLSSSTPINVVNGIVDISGPAEVEQIITGSSIISQWIEPVQIRKDISTIPFSGVVFGGYAGDIGQVFTLVLKSKNPGEILVTVKNTQGYINDGNGTYIALKSAPLKINVTSEDSHIVSPVIQDTTPPEEFSPEVYRDSVLTENKWLVSFITQDKGSGIERYMVKEGSGDFVDAASPYVLKSDPINEEITVRAIDRLGNMRDAVVTPLDSKEQNPYIFLLFVAGLLLVSLTWRNKTKIKK